MSCVRTANWNLHGVPEHRYNGQGRMYELGSYVKVRASYIKRLDVALTALTLTCLRSCCVINKGCVGPSTTP